MHCTKCKNLDRRHGECIPLVPYVWCQRCRERYLMNQVRCPKCQLASTDEVAILEQDATDYVASKHCPLTDRERDALVRAQNAPLQNQMELF